MADMKKVYDDLTIINLYLPFSQKMNEKIRLYYYGTSSQIVSIRFLGELKTPKGHIEINLPLKASVL